MHHIQSKILHQLLYVRETNYASLRPAGVESNHFAYHLEQLIRDGLIEKHDKSYLLSPRGLAYVDRLSQTAMNDRLQPHIVTAIDLTAPNGKTLLFKRNFQPYIHLVGLPVGKMHYDETVGAAAVRELQEKTGITDVALQHRGMVYIRAAKDGFAIGRVLYHVFHGDVDAELPAQAPSERGECYWGDHTQLRPDECMPGFLRIKQLLAESTELFFDELSFDLSAAKS
jgi:ADP-ribose pyrophosphatase YjhB (NUDIX family)